MDRKSFFDKAFKLAIGKGLSLLEGNLIINQIEKSAPRQRPPGAILEEEFQVHCTGCDACMAACPVNVIMIDDQETRWPLIYPDTAPCIHCEGYPCIASCPTGALIMAASTELRFIV